MTRSTMADDGFEPATAAETEVMRLGQVSTAEVADLLLRFGLSMVILPAGAPIPGSYWGDSEAGLIGNQLYTRIDTPLHSLLHEACHFICMDQQRRERLDRDAGGDFAEENAVCYLQIVLADFIRPLGRLRMYRDMDTWGYTFRLGSAQTWFEQDAADARHWLSVANLVDEAGFPCWRVRCE